MTWGLTTCVSCRPAARRPMHLHPPSAWHAADPWDDDEALRSCIVLIRSLSRCLQVLSGALVSPEGLGAAKEAKAALLHSKPIVLIVDPTTLPFLPPPPFCHPLCPLPLLPSSTTRTTVRACRRSRPQGPVGPFSPPKIARPRH